MKKIIRYFSGLSVLGLSLLFTPISWGAQLTAPQTVFQFNQGTIAPVLEFNQAETGDIYLAFRVAGEGDYYFVQADGSLTTQAAVFASIDQYTGSYTLPSYNTANLSYERYQLYAVIVNRGGSVYDVNDWSGGFAGLSQINFSLGGAEIGDLDSDLNGWFDDDLNLDGFHDSDSNFDGYYDNDADKNGYPDDGSITNTTATSPSTTNSSTTTSNTSTNTTDTNNSNGTDSTTTANTTESSISRGMATYETYCLACHGTDPTRNRDGILAGRSASNTVRAIQRNEGGMGFLSTLSDTDLQDIADYLNSL